MKSYLLILFVCVCSGLNAQISQKSDFDRLLSLNCYYEILHQIDSLQKEGAIAPELFYYGGKANEGVMRYNEAYLYYLKWYESDTTHMMARQTLARIANLAGHRTEAMERYEQLARQDSLNFTINYALGRLYQQAGRHADAFQVYQRQYNVDTTNVTLLTRMGDCLVDLGLLTDAIPIYKKAFYFDTKNSGLSIKMVNVLLGDRDLIPVLGEEVEAVIDSASFWSPKSVKLRQNQGILKYVMKKYKATQEIFTGLQEQGDSSKVTFKFLGLAFSRQGDYTKALPCLKRADELYRDAKDKRTDVEVALKYAEALCKTWKAKEALQVLEEIVGLLQPNPYLVSQIALFEGMSYAILHQKDKAIQAYWDAFQAHPSNLTALANLAYMTSSLWFSAQENNKKVNYRMIWYVQILYLQTIEESSHKEQHEYSRKILGAALETMFFTGKKQLETEDPDGKKYVYDEQDIRQLLKQQ